MDAYPRRAGLTFHGVEAGRGWDLIYDEKVGDPVPISYLLSIHPDLLLSRKRPQVQIGR